MVVKEMFSFVIGADIGQQAKSVYGLAIVEELTTQAGKM